MKELSKTLLNLEMLGIVNRDIKPRNIVLSSDYKSFKLIDFGIAIDFSIESDNQFVFAGSPAFMSPEVFESFNT